MPPVAVQGSRNDTIELDRSIEESQHRAYQRQTFVCPGCTKHHLARIAKNLPRDSPCQVDLQSSQIARLWISIAKTRHILFDSYNQIAAWLDLIKQRLTPDFLSRACSLIRAVLRLPPADINQRSGQRQLRRVCNRLIRKVLCDT